MSKSPASPERPTRISRVTVRPLDVPLTEPFVIASATMTTTRAVLVRVTCENGAFGLGEGACLPPVTHEDQPDVISAIEKIAARLEGVSVDSLEKIAEIVTPLDHAPVARASLEMALLDCFARSRSVPLAELFATKSAYCTHLVSDVTLPILEEAETVRLLCKWYARGFTAFKVKVGRDLEKDARSLATLASEVRGATFRIDANGGYDAKDAIDLFERATKAGAKIECFEQPCAKDDFEGMAKVARAVPIPVVADESVRSLADVEKLAETRAADGVNLKVMKFGGVARAIEIGKRARALGMKIMVGGMVETRLGMTAGAHVAAVLDGVDYVDLDTAFLLDDDPFLGGYRADGPRLQIYGEGLGVFERRV